MNSEQISKKIITVVAKLYTKDGSKGRKLKPGNKITLQNLIEKQLKKKPIVTLGLFQKLPADIGIKIHDKKQYKFITKQEYSKIADIILKSFKEPSKDCIVCITPKGIRMLECVKKGNYGTFNVRSIFNTQERQLVLG